MVTMEQQSAVCRISCRDSLGNENSKAKIEAV